MVKPVDLQDNLSKTQLLEKVQQLQKSTPEEAQKQFAQELQKKLSQGKERVADLPKSDKIIIHRDEKRKQEKEQKTRKEQKDDKEDKENNDLSPEDNAQQDNNKKRIDYIA